MIQLNTKWAWLYCLYRNELIPKLKEYNTFFEGRKALQLTSKEVMLNDDTSNNSFVTSMNEITIVSNCAIILK